MIFKVKFNTFVISFCFQITISTLSQVGDVTHVDVIGKGQSPRHTVIPRQDNVSVNKWDKEWQEEHVMSVLRNFIALARNMGS